MTPEDYVEKLGRLDELMGIDPQDSDSNDYQELCALSAELEAYEQATWPNLFQGPEDVGADDD